MCTAEWPWPYRWQSWEGAKNSDEFCKTLYSRWLFKDYLLVYYTDMTFAEHKLEETQLNYNNQEKLLY